MKVCPFCAESVQDAAVVCKHCGRDIPAAAADAPRTLFGGSPSNGPTPAPTRQPAAPPATPPKSGSSTRKAALAGGLAVALVAWVLASTGTADVGAQASVADVELPPPPPPTVIRVGDGKAFVVRASGYVSWKWTVDDSRPCMLKGRVTGISGGRQDVKVHVMTEDQFANYERGLETPTVASSEQVAAYTLNAALPGPGTYRLVISNRFSAFTDKTVELNDAQVSCGG